MRASLVFLLLLTLCAGCGKDTKTKAPPPPTKKELKRAMVVGTWACFYWGLSTGKSIWLELNENGECSWGEIDVDKGHPSEKPAIRSLAKGKWKLIGTEDIQLTIDGKKRTFTMHKLGDKQLQLAANRIVEYKLVRVKQSMTIEEIGKLEKKMKFDQR